VKVLLIEDSSMVLGFLREVLPRAGAEIVGEAGVPQAAANTLRERKPDALLIDLDRRDALSLVKIAVSEAPGLFVIGYAANCTESLVVEASNAGVSDMLAKPLSEARLLEALAKCTASPVPEPPDRAETDASADTADEPAGEQEAATEEPAAPAEEAEGGETSGEKTDQAAG